MVYKSSLYKRIYVVVRNIPPGKVATYGQVAKISVVLHARIVGYAMAAVPPDSDIPWQRVINHQGKISPRSSGNGGTIQRQYLEAEGIRFDRNGRVDLKIYGWKYPDSERIEGDFFNPELPLEDTK
ncbi:MAG: cysteine methyltransferase [Candidatus Latescibacteria bacterium]|jgi:methylated-DNA-protein-cysteine methyltransferase related protein|nr:cysteine methyltransferase [Candidatus Latescibacterota bacterium]